MQALFVILKQADLVNELIHELAHAGVKGGTIFEGTGMASALAAYDDLPIFSVIRRIVEDEDNDSCKVLLFILEEKEAEQVRAVIRDVVGDFNRPNSGIMFAMPVTFVEGLGNRNQTAEAE